MDLKSFNNSLLKKPKGQTVLYCFSPPVMVATVIIEVGLAVWTLFRYRRGMFAKVAVAILLLLAAFQVSEYQVCGGHNAQIWSRFGLIAITFLPVAGLYLIRFITKNKITSVIGAITALFFVLYYIFAPKNEIVAFCGGNYVIFAGPSALYQFFGAYYFGFLVLTIWHSVKAIYETKSTLFQRVLKWLVAGYLSFMLPLVAVYVFFAPARSAVASVMCGFALIFALILAFEIVPNFYKLEEAEKLKPKV